MLFFVFNSMKKFDCCCIGRSCVDYIALVENYPKKNTKTKLIEYEICVGGQAANASLVLANLGLKTLLITPIGKDFYSKIIKNSLSKIKNLKVNFIELPQIKTPVAFIWTELKSAERTIVYEKVYSSNIYPKKYIEKSNKLSKYILFDHQSLKSIYESIKIIKKQNTQMIMDAERKDDYLFKILPFVDYFICSLELAKDLNIKPIKLLKEFINKGPKIVCCTLGEKGAIAVIKDNKNKIYYSKALKIKPKDTTGAGDVFHAGFVYGLIRNWGIKNTLDFSNKLAGISTFHLGGSKFCTSKEFQKIKAQL